MNNQIHTKCMSETEMSHYNSRMSQIINELSAIRHKTECIDQMAKEELTCIKNDINKWLHSIDEQVKSKVTIAIDNKVEDAKNSCEREYKRFIEERAFKVSGDIEKEVSKICCNAENSVKNYSKEYERMLKRDRKRIDLLIERIKKDGIKEQNEGV